MNLTSKLEELGFVEDTIQRMYYDHQCFRKTVIISESRLKELIESIKKEGDVEFEEPLIYYIVIVLDRSSENADVSEDASVKIYKNSRRQSDIPDSSVFEGRLSVDNASTVLNALNIN